MTFVAFWWLIKMIFSVEQYNANMKNLIHFFGIFSLSFLTVKMLSHSKNTWASSQWLERQIETTWKAASQDSNFFPTNSWPLLNIVNSHTNTYSYYKESQIRQHTHTHKKKKHKPTHPHTNTHTPLLQTITQTDTHT
jgi:hypothetical protein